MMYFIYILYSPERDVYYIGSSGNPQKRLEKHMSSHKGFTSTARDWTICYIEAFNTKTEALKREKQLKGWRNRSRIKELIDRSSGLSSDG